MEAPLTSEAKNPAIAALGGVISILPTPFTPEGAIDDEGFANVTEAAIASGAHGLAMFGLASEYYKLSDAHLDAVQKSELAAHAFRLSSRLIQLRGKG